MTKLLVAVIGVLVVTTGVLGFVLWDMKSRDAGLTVQLARDNWAQSGYEVRMARDGEIKVTEGIETGPFRRGKTMTMHLVFSITHNGSPAAGLTVRASVLEKNPPSSGLSIDLFGSITGSAPPPDRRILLKSTPKDPPRIFRYNRLQGAGSGHPLPSIGGAR